MTTLIHADYVLTMDDRRRVLRNAAVAVEGTRITGVGPWAQFRAQFPTASVVGDGSGILAPGLINAHTHFSEGLLASLGEGMTLYEWGKRVILPAGRGLDREMAHVGTALKGCELLASGVTTVSDMFVHGHPNSFASLGVVDALEQLGLRAVVCFGAEDLAFTGQVDGQQFTINEILDEHQALAERARATQRIGFRMGIGTLLGQTPELLRCSVALARAEGWGVHTHLAEVREEMSFCRTYHQMTPVGYAAAHGLLELDLLAAHCNWLTETDLHMLQAAGVHIIHNPIANMLLASGVCPVPRMLGMNMNVCLGTDGAASNNNQNMFQLMKTTALLHKLVALDAATMTAEQVVWMATRGGARALGLEHQVGSIEIGKCADLLLLNGNTATLAPIHDPYNQIVYAATGREVSDVWIDGVSIVANGRVLTVDEGTIAGRARTAATELVRRIPELQHLSTLHRTEPYGNDSQGVTEYQKQVAG